MPRQIPARRGEHGEVFTRRWVVELILDLVGYRAEHDLGGSVIVEPACGRGAFLVPIVERLVESCARHGRPLADMSPAIRGLDLLEHNVELARKAVTAKLLEFGEPLEVAERLSQEWVTVADFLLTEHGPEGLPRADFVVGNPPYIRLEDVPPATSQAYRSECSTMRGRADIYVGFIEKGLALLAEEGRLAFICADRWMHNQYGEHLRAHIADNYAMDVVVVMHDVDAFEDEVSAYPAITVLRNGRQGRARVVEARDGFNEEAGQAVVRWLDRKRGATAPTGRTFAATTLDAWFRGGGHWPAGSPRGIGLIADLEERFSPLEDPRTGTRVGIGIATGCDDVFVVGDGVGVEPSRLMPLLTAADIATGVPRWSGKFLVNPWEGGRLVDLADYPGIASYLDRHGERVRSRHVARRRPSTWYRTIDRITPGLQSRPKLLLPDLKAASHPVLELGEYYPHHNLYYIVSDAWDLELLGGLLLSDIANLFVGAYCVKMRGGTYRFQAQYLRKIRVPAPDSVDEDIAAVIAGAFRARDRGLATEAAAELYGIDRSDLPQLSAV